MMKSTSANEGGTSTRANAAGGATCSGSSGSPCRRRRACKDRREKADTRGWQAGIDLDAAAITTARATLASANRLQPSESFVINHGVRGELGLPPCVTALAYTRLELDLRVGMMQI